MYANRNSNSGDQDEGRRFSMISIPQSFAWTGLKKHSGKKNDVPTTLAMEGLVLWNILGFALNDAKHYGVFSLVNKEWNQVVKTLEPPSIFRMRVMLSEPNTQDLTADDMSLLSDVFHVLKARDSTLYRKDRNSSLEGETSGISEKWPVLQPQFALLMLRFTYQGSSQRSSRCAEIYELTIEFFEHIATATVQKVVKSLEKLEETAPSSILQELVEHWIAWSGIVRTVTGMTGYLDRYYVKHHSLKSLMEQARQKLLQAILDEKAKLVEPMNKCLKLIYSNERNAAKAGMDRQLLVEVLETSEKLLAFQTSQQWDAVVGTSQIQENYARIRGLMAEGRIVATEQDVTAPNRDGDADDTDKDSSGIITLTFPNGTKLDAGKHFVDSSSVFSHLHLGNGDCVRWDTDSDIPLFRKVLEFYAMDSQTPMPPVAPPLQSPDLSVIVGQQYANFVGSMDKDTLFEVIIFANFLGTTKLLDLTGLAVAALIRGSSPAEIRALFNIG